MKSTDATELTDTTESLIVYHYIMEQNARFKRFNERWVADPDFRSQLAEDIPGTLERYSIPCEPSEGEGVLDYDPANPPETLRAMWQIVAAKSKLMQRFYHEDGIPQDVRMRAWRDRQIARQLLDLGPFHTNSSIHSSLSVELTKGCSVGCWFCALSPDRLSGAPPYDEVGELWRGILRVMYDALGSAAGTGFLYWATDPFDHPDYEKFCIDFHEIVGVFPPTTTALAHKDPARTRAMLKLAQERDCWLNRLSITNLKLLDRVHGEFSADELAMVECLAVNRESSFAFGNAGRFRDRTMADPALMEKQKNNLRFAPWYTADPAYENSDDYPLATIGCVTGFLMNLVSRRVQLISPCSSSDTWPLGYYIYAEAGFETPEELGAVIESMIERHMSPTLLDDYELHLLDFLTIEFIEDGFRLAGRFKGYATFAGSNRAADWKHIGEALARGGETASQIAASVSKESGLATDIVRAMLDELFRAGVLDELRFQ